MSTRITTVVVAMCLAGAAAGAAAQPADKNAERAARRAQLQAQAVQQQLQEAQAAKAKLEADKASSDKALALQSQQAGHLKAQLRKSGDELKAAEAARAQLAATVAALESQLVEQKRLHDEALAQKGRELLQFTKQRDEQQRLLQRRHDDQLAQVGECTAKNAQLVQLNAELADRWRSKSLIDVLKQRDQLLGLGDVQMFNLVQDYRDKAEAERFSPSANR